MQIKKINNDKLTVILSSHDLSEKQIDVDSFLSNSIESQDLFFEILDLAEENYSFTIENNKALIETISLDNNMFIVNITKLKNDSPSVESKTKTIYCFETINDFLTILPVLKQNNLYISYDVYEYNLQYYLFFTSSIPNIEDQLLEYSTFVNNNLNIPFLLEHGKKIQEQ